MHNLTNLKQFIEAKIKTPVSSIEKLKNVTNNTVYKFRADKEYIFKIYRSSNWPENGKLSYISNTLTHHHISCAKLIVFDRSEPLFPNGYLLEEFVPGMNSQQIKFDTQMGLLFYKQLANLMKKIHNIPIKNFGYIGYGEAEYSTFLSFMNDKFDEIAQELINSICIKASLIDKIKPLIFSKMQLCNHLPSVLTHGDLSTKNVIINDNQLILIDWDDAMSYNWIADVARLTYWMKFEYNNIDYITFRNSFLSHYASSSDLNLFLELEHVFHIWIGMDHLNYYRNTAHYEVTMNYLNETIATL